MTFFLPPPKRDLNKIVEFFCASEKSGTMESGVRRSSPLSPEIQNPSCLAHVLPSDVAAFFTARIPVAISAVSAASTQQDGGGEGRGGGFSVL